MFLKRLRDLVGNGRVVRRVENHREIGCPVEAGAELWATSSAAREACSAVDRAAAKDIDETLAGALRITS